MFSGTYTTPKTPGDSLGAHVVSRLARDWQLGSVLRDQNGASIESPTSINQLTNQLGRGTGAITSARTSVGGVYTGGYGTLATINGAGAVPRSGQAVLRLTF